MLYLRLPTEYLGKFEKPPPGENRRAVRGGSFGASGGIPVGAVTRVFGGENVENPKMSMSPKAIGSGANGEIATVLLLLTPFSRS